MIASFKQKKVIGIIGGLGPFAHIEFEKKLLKAAAKIVNARKDQDFPQWLLSSIPKTPDRTLAICENGESPVPAIVQSLKKLETLYDKKGEKISGADFAVIICNTSHNFFSEIEKQVNISLLNMIEITSKKIARIHPKARVGILATTGTLKSRLYHDSLCSFGLTPKSPLDLSGGETIQHKMVMETIYGIWDGKKFTGGGIKSGNIKKKFTDNFHVVVDLLIDSLQVDIFIAGCTEIPLALPGTVVKEKILIDPMWVVAETAVKIAYGLEEYN